MPGKEKKLAWTRLSSLINTLTGSTSVYLHLPRTTLQIGLSYTMVMENLCCMYIQQSAAANQSINHQSIIYLYQTRLLCSRHRPDFTRQTDRRQTKASLNASALTGLGIPILLRKVAMALCKGIYVKFGVFEGVWPWKFWFGTLALFGLFE